MAINDRSWDIGFHKENGDESNPTWAIVLGQPSYTLHICDPLNAGTDWNVSAATVPTVYIHGSASAPTTYTKITGESITLASGGIIYGTNLQINAGGTAVQLSNAASWTASGTGSTTVLGATFPGASASVKMWLKLLDNVGTAIYYVPVYGL